MECFSGSSGSPIFINRDSQYYLVGIEQSSYSYKEKEVGLGECVKTTMYFLHSYHNILQEPSYIETQIDFLDT